MQHPKLFYAFKRGPPANILDHVASCQHKHRAGHGRNCAELHPPGPNSLRPKETISRSFNNSHKLVNEIVRMQSHNISKYQFTKFQFQVFIEATLNCNSIQF